MGRKLWLSGKNAQIIESRNLVNNLGNSSGANMERCRNKH